MYEAALVAARMADLEREAERQRLLGVARRSRPRSSRRLRTGLGELWTLTRRRGAAVPAAGSGPGSAGAAPAH